MPTPLTRLLLIFSLLLPGPVFGQVLFEDDFESNGLTRFTQVLRGSTPFSLSANGLPGNAGQIGNNGQATVGADSQTSGWLQPTGISVDANSDFFVTFDFRIVNEAGFDDCAFLMGDLVNGDYYVTLVTEASDNNDVFYNNSFVREDEPALDSFANQAIADDTWYNAVCSWNAATDQLEFTVSEEGSAAVVASYSITLDSASSSMPSLKNFTNGVQFGFGTFNDTALFDNIQIVEGTFVEPGPEPGTPFQIANLDLDQAAAGALGTLPENWTFAWNPTGVAIGDVANYETLTPVDNDWRNQSPDALGTDGDPNNSVGVYDTSSASSYGGVAYLNSGLSAESSSDGLDHYVIVGYTIQPGEEGYITFNVDLDSMTHSTFRLFKGSENMDRRVYPVNGRKRPTLYAGFAEAGETIYLAMLATDDVDTFARRRFSGNIVVETFNTALEPNHGLSVRNHAPGHTLGYPLALLRGTCDPSATEVIISNLTSGDDPVSWPALGGYYKGMVLLRGGIGANDILIDDGVDQMNIPLSFVDPGNTRRVNPMYLLASDSTGDFIAPPGEPNDIASAQKRISIMALMLQTFTAQSLADAGHEPRTFSLNLDPDTGLPITQVLFTDVTEQGGGAGTGMRQGYLEFTSDTRAALITSVANQAIARALGRPSGTILDGNVQDLTILGFTTYNFNGNPGELRGNGAAAIGTTSAYSSQTLHTWAESIADIPVSLTDRTDIDFDVTPDDSAFRASNWANYSSAIGVCMHEIGHFLISQNGPMNDVFGIAVPHLDALFEQYGVRRSDIPDTIMGRGGDDMNRFFTVGAGGGLHPSIGTDSGRAFWNSDLLRDYVFNCPLLKPIDQIDFQTWQGNFSGASPAELAEDADPDNDGLNNLLEFATGRNPFVFDKQGAFELLEGENGVATLSYERLTPLVGQTFQGTTGVDFLSNGLQYGLSYSSNLNIWNPAQTAEVTLLGDPQNIGNGRQRVEVQLAQPSQDRAFFRLAVTPNTSAASSASLQAPSSNAVDTSGITESQVVSPRSSRAPATAHDPSTCPTCSGIHTILR